MDPVGPWYASYNRLTTGTAAGAFQAGGATASGDFVSHHLGSPTTINQTSPSPSSTTSVVVPTTTSQLLLQSSQTTASLAGQSPPFNSGGFLSPPPVGYDVFSPLFHHSNVKQAHYNVTTAGGSQRGGQTMVQSQTSTVSKQTTPEPEVVPGVVRENYTTSQTSFFEHQSQTTSPTTSALPWNSSSSQLPSPFGILPHESVVSPSPAVPPATKPTNNSSSYENNFNPHFTTGQPIGTINSYATDNGKKLSRSASPVTIKSTSPGTTQSFFQQTSTTFDPDLAASYSNDNTASKVQSTLHQQQSCIVSTSNIDHRVPQTHSSPVSTIFQSTGGRPTAIHTQDKNSVVQNPQPVQTKAQTKSYADIGNHDHQRTDTSLEASQSSPISFSMMDARTLNYAPSTPNNCASNASGKITTSTQRTPPNTNLHQQQQYHVINQQQSQQPALPPQQQTTPYRHYSTGSQSESEYHHPGRSKSAASTDSAYSSNTSTQNGPDCGVVVPRRPSPLQAHSQASPLSHVPSPAYPMYNSPMAAMSSPSPLPQHGDNSASNQCANAQTYKAIQQQVTPPSPLDVSVSRPASQGQVAYSSVITRVLGTSDNTKANYSAENRSYEHQDFVQRPKQQLCWDNNDTRPAPTNRKFPMTAYLPNNAEINSQTLSSQQQQQQLNIPERQQGYFDSSQVPLQDLSSCRAGDSMSIVKNIHQSTSCQIQQQQQQQQLGGVPQPEDPQKQVEERQRKIDPTKKRRSFEKSSIHSSTFNDLSTTSTPVMNDYLSRVPPPAHHNSNQQPQNGYFDFERWNLASGSKMFTSSAGPFGSQSTIHHAGNYAGNSTTHQHQSLMVSHHTPPINPIPPYFPAFHLPPGHHPGHHPHEYHQSSMDVSSIGYIGDNSTSGHHHHLHHPHHHNSSSTGGYQDFRDDQPKVIVPNIEEELGFLQSNQLPVETANQVNRDLKPACKDPNTGFMTSYLKFLQGEREPSPPPAIRGGRKATWNRSKPYLPHEPIKSISDITASAATNGDLYKGLNSAKETPTIDYANDPRYFPLPKERKKPYIDSSDDGIMSEDDFPFTLKKNDKNKLNNSSSNNNNNNSNNNNNNMMSNVDNNVVKPPPKKKGRPIKPGGPTDRKRKAAAAAAAAAAADAAAGRPQKKTDNNLLLLPPRRETSKRKAKEKVSTKQLAENSDDDEQGDSDSDPAWTPAAKLTGDDDDKKKKRGRPVISKKTRKMLDDDDYSSSDLIPKKGRKKSDHKNSVLKIDEKLLASVSDEDIDISPFKSGEFVVIKAELKEEYPALWRIDGKTLLQKYEPFDSNGKTLYRNISTYSGWTPQNRHMYQQVPVKFWQQGKLETIVEFLRDEMIIDDRECINRSIKENEKYQDNFEVYVQTLISQALDSNFLTEIFQEHDEYFLSNVKMIDEITEERKRRLLSTTKWQKNVVTVISTWPCLNVLKDLSSSECKGKQCSGCQHSQIHARVLLYGQPYNATTLEGSPPDPAVPHEKDFLLCRVCQKKVALFNKVAHQKYLMFLECARRVSDRRIADPNKDTTTILNELLADETWLNQLFKEVRTIWAEIDSIEYQSKSKLITNSNNSTSPPENQDLNPEASNVPLNTDFELSTQQTESNNCLLNLDTNNEDISANIS
ncbi:putative uncharacterized protein DDB_G0277255 isoform X1 [Microplitis demolitor]|uniref:putative uncharacterized protein DDB_G0277255 isoform X1 n=1 Tax=Microplitis demolitor TaxID=69319 RepID=UPI0004CD8072|nr:putative uncharacterized protein DDB_G0277255 isoform X1 [Microplitis demolitor]